MAAEVQEVVLDTDAVDAEHLAVDLGEALLGGGARRDVRGGEVGPGQGDRARADRVGLVRRPQGAVHDGGRGTRDHGAAGGPVEERREGANTLTRRQRIGQHALLVGLQVGRHLGLVGHADPGPHVPVDGDGVAGAACRLGLRGGGEIRVGRGVVRLPVGRHQGGERGAHDQRAGLVGPQRGEEVAHTGDLGPEDRAGVVVLAQRDGATAGDTGRVDDAVDTAEAGPHLVQRTGQ